MHDVSGGATRRGRLVRSEDDQDPQDEPMPHLSERIRPVDRPPVLSLARQREPALEAIALTVAGRPEDALALLGDRPGSPLAQAVLAVLRRLPPPRDHDEAFLLWRALEAWQAGASLAPIRAEESTSAAVQIVLSAPARER